MYSTRGKAVVWLAVLGFGAATAAGPWMHFVPGLGHSCHQCGRDDSSAPVGPSSSAVESATVWQHASSENCPICQFFSLAKNLDCQAIALDHGLAVGTALWLLSRPVSANLQLHYDARAPPVIG